MATWAWILIAVAVVIMVVVAVIAMMRARRRRTAALRQHYGTEYDRTVQSRRNRRTAEAELRGRQSHRARFDIRPLSEHELLRLAAEWREVQEHFVDKPADAVVAGDRLVYRVMEARGYPMGNFEEQADLVSVDHPQVVQDYRVAHRIRLRAEEGEAATEELRTALLRYRSLFAELLRADGAGTRATADQDSTAEPGARVGSHPVAAEDGVGPGYREAGGAGYQGRRGGRSAS
jgi:hypothetical protein